MEFTSAREAANDPRILTFGRLLGAANRLEYILGKSLEESAGITHTIYELLLLVGRAGEKGVPVRDVAQSRVLTSGGATRLVRRAEELGLIERKTSLEDGRVQLLTLTPHGEHVAVNASTLHAANIERLLIDIVDPGVAAEFSEALKDVSVNAARVLPSMP
jgi:DNA-binding MarR family transcriptional regulator